MATIFKHRLSADLQDPSGIFETFALAAPSRDVAKDECVIKTVLRVVKRTNDVDDEIVRVVGGGLLPEDGADAAAQKNFRREFCDLLELHAYLELLGRPAAAPVPPLQQAVQRLFQLEAACSRSNRATGLTVPGEDDTLWRSVALKLLKSLRITVVQERPEETPRISCEGPRGADDIAAAARALFNLEKLLLCHSLHVMGHGNKVETSMGRILMVRWGWRGRFSLFSSHATPSSPQSWYPTFAGGRRRCRRGRGVCALNGPRPGANSSCRCCA